MTMVVEAEATMLDQELRSDCDEDKVSCPCCGCLYDGCPNCTPEPVELPGPDASDDLPTSY